MTYSDCSGYIIQKSDDIALRGCQPDGGADITSDIWVQSYTGSVLLTSSDNDDSNPFNDGTFSAWNSSGASITNRSIYVAGVNNVEISNYSLYAFRDIQVSDAITITSGDGGVRLASNALLAFQDIAAGSIAIVGRSDVSLNLSLFANQSIQVSDAITITSGDGGVTLASNALFAGQDIAAGSIAIVGRSDVSLNNSLFVLQNIRVSDGITITSGDGGVTLETGALYAFQGGIAASSIAIAGKRDVSLRINSLRANQSIRVSDAITITSSDGGVKLDERALYASNDIAARSIMIAGRSDVFLGTSSLFSFLGTLQVSDIRLTSTHGAIRLGRGSDNTNPNFLSFNNAFYAGSDGSRVGRVTFAAEELNLRAGPGMSGIYNADGVITIDFCGVKNFTGTPSDYRNFFQVSGYEKTGGSFGSPGTHPNNTTDRLDLYVPTLSDNTQRDALIQSALQRYNATIFCCSTSGCSDGCYSDAAGCLLCTPGNYCANQAKTPCQPGTYNPAYGSSLPSACLPCPAGTFNPSDGSTSLSSCLPCAAGFTSSDGATLCQPVPTTEPEPQVPAFAPDPLRLLLLFLLYWLGLFLLLLLLLEALL